MRSSIAAVRRVAHAWQLQVDERRSVDRSKPGRRRAGLSNRLRERASRRGPRPRLQPPTVRLPGGGGIRTKRGFPSPSGQALGSHRPPRARLATSSPQLAHPLLSRNGSRSPLPQSVMGLREVALGTKSTSPRHPPSPTANGVLKARRGLGPTSRLAQDSLIGHQAASGAQIHVYPRTSEGIRCRKRRLFVPESPPLRNQEVGGSSPPSSSRT